MIRANEPKITINDTLNACIGEITKPELKQRLTLSEDLFVQQSSLYKSKGKSGVLHTIAPKQLHGSSGQQVFGNLTKSELISLYDYYLRDKPKGKGRELYEEILISVTHCPCCGGLGERPNTIDHYLPKSYFPQFSILPLNLIPTCSICNTDYKSAKYATTQDAQVIHPILDGAHFFNDQWIFATYQSARDDEPGSFTFRVSPPDQWSDVDRARVMHHFNQFGLAHRYANKAATELRDTLAPLTQNHLASMAELIEVNLRPLIKDSQYANYWKKIMFEALVEDYEH